MRTEPTRPPDFIAVIRLDPNEHARFHRNGLHTGFIATHDFHHPAGGVNDGVHFLIERDTLPVGIWSATRVWLLAPERQARRFFPGFEFDILAGAAIVGSGSIKQVINDLLVKAL
jgi:hypothetical protein